MRSLDLQVNLSQMVNVAQLQQATQHHPLLHQEHLLIKAKDEAKIKHERVMDVEKSGEGRRVEEEGRGSGGYFGNSRKGYTKKEKGKGSDIDPSRGRLVDVVG